MHHFLGHTRLIEVVMLKCISQRIVVNVENTRTEMEVLEQVGGASRDTRFNA
jgi:hypothetical protein